MTTMISADALIAVIVASDFRRCEWESMCHSDLKIAIGEFAKNYDPTETTDLIDMAPAMCTAINVAWSKVQESHGDDYGMRMLEWIGHYFADLVAADFNMNHC